MYKTLSPGAVSLHVRGLEQAIAAARQGGFGGVEFSAQEVADLIDAHDAAHVKGMFDAAGLRPASFGLAVDWRSTEENWRKGLEELPRQAQAAAAIGCTRTATWIMPCSDERPLAENRAFHIERFTPIARILAENGISIGLEFIGPKTLRDSQKYPFIHTMEAMLEMGAEIGPNVGLLLDAWHLYTSHGKVEQILSLRPEQVVYVHVNDAPANIPIDEQVDNVRCLPGETGVIDIAGFLQALQKIGYDGPVTPEPFKKELAELPSDDIRLQFVRASMDTIFARAGLE